MAQHPSRVVSVATMVTLLSSFFSNETRLLMRWQLLKNQLSLLCGHLIAQHTTN